MRQKQHLWACSAYHSWALWAVCRRTPSPSARPGRTRRTGARGPRSTCGAEALFYCSTCHKNTSHTFGSGAEHERTVIYLWRKLAGHDLIRCETSWGTGRGNWLLQWQTGISEGWTQRTECGMNSSTLSLCWHSVKMLLRQKRQERAPLASSKSSTSLSIKTHEKSSFQVPSHFWEKI